MRGFGWIGALIGLVLVIGAGVIGYNIGLSANIGASGATVGTVAYPAFGWGFGFGFFPFFGFIFFFLILFLIFGAFRRGRGWGGPGGHGYWQGRSEAFEEWHRQQHGGGTETTDQR
jgi:hypothetical protein